MVRSSFTVSRTSRVSVLAFVVAQLAGVGCAAFEDNIGTQEAENRVVPVDNEVLGNVVVRRPPGGSVFGFTVKVGNAVATPDQPLRVREGTHVLSLVHDGADWGNVERPKSQYRRIQVKRNETTTVDLSAILFQFGAPDLAEGDLNVLGAPTFDLTVENQLPSDCGGRSWTCSVNTYTCQPSGNGTTCWTWYVSGRTDKGTHATKDACSSACPSHSVYGALSPVCAQPSDLVCDQGARQTLVSTKTLEGAWSGASPSAVAFLPGSYTIVSPGGTAGVTLSGGAYQVVAQGASNVTRGGLLVQAPAERDLPNHRDDKLIVELPGTGRNRAVVDPTTTTTVKAVGFGPAAGNATATLGPRKIALSLRNGETTKLALGRIDVTDVLVTRENGTTYNARGTYTVTCTTDGTAIGSFSTSKGVDVLPGDYRVDLSYSTEEGPRSQTFRLHY
jgi:hypothetical protein